MKRNKKAIEFYSTQTISRKDKDIVNKVLSSDFLSRGPKIVEFERSLGRFCDNNFVLSVNSATSALQLAYHVNNVEPKTRVWTSPITFVATSNAAVHFGAEIDFVDIDRDTLNISIHALEEKLIKAKSQNKMPSILTVVHFAGNPCDMEAIANLAKNYNFKILEDASHALGASYKNERIGNNKYSDGCIFSFHPVKMITTGEGGCLLLKNKEQFVRAESLRSHGIAKTNAAFYNERPAWFYEQTDLGYNYRLSEIQAALGLSQMLRLESFVKKRNRLALRYKKNLRGLPVKFQKIMDGSVSSFHLFTIEICDEGFSRNQLYYHLKEKSIASQVHYIPVHLQPFYLNRGFSEGMYENSEKYYSRCLSLPLHPGITFKDVDYVCEKITEFFSKTSR